VSVSRRRRELVVRRVVRDSAAGAADRLAEQIACRHAECLDPRPPCAELMSELVEDSPPEHRLPDAARPGDERALVSIGSGTVEQPDQLLHLCLAMAEIRREGLVIEDLLTDNHTADSQRGLSIKTRVELPGWN